MPVARILSIAGSDSSGGAGIQADIKTITALGAYASTAITALTDQNTLGIHDILPTPPDFIRAQIRSVIDDIGVDAIKTGMLGDSNTITAIAEEIKRAIDNHPHLHIIVDPVMIAKGGTHLLQTDSITTVKNYLFPLASIITPNIPEAEQLTHKTITTISEMDTAARYLHETTGATILLKGGHLHGDQVVDILVNTHTLHHFTASRISSHHTHGTGCTLASALATYLAQGITLYDAVEQARLYVRNAILQAPQLGSGSGPLWHAMNSPPSLFDNSPLKT
ncbi:MAG: bifunctional hydroxymethylpyrimidine kinase/phosphomethylpyrimidine kinase [Acetobacter sp.]|nr:bifunctional hydroxymethylpyrimidine kinase/phosphomethylpyrimidine kinase [Acetobacter sp.]